MIDSTTGISHQIDRMLHTLMVSIFIVAALLFLGAPVLALSWQNQPFAGFIVGSSLVVNDVGMPDWPGISAGITYPQKVERIAGQQVFTPNDINRVLAAHQVGDTIAVFTRTQDGKQHLYPAIPLIAFPAQDLWRFFWVPYLVGAVYLIIGGWIYQMRGRSRSGRTLALFCIYTASICVLLFDIYTTHYSDLLWILIMANVGGTLFSLALRFPEEWLPVRSHSWILTIPYLISIGLGLWGALTLFDQQNPWLFLPALDTIYRYAAVNMLAFLGVIIYRTRTGSTLIIRQQARLVLAGSFIAFLPVSVWLLAPLFSHPVNFTPVAFLPPLLVFPISIGLAILRFRLWDIDTLVNRAFVYGVATAILAGVFSALIALSQRFFVAFTGEKSDAAIVLTTLIIFAIFTPLRSRVQGFVDRHLREEEDHLQELRAFGSEVQAFVQMSSVERISKRLLAEAVQSLGAESGALRLLVDGRMLVTLTHGPWKNDARLSLSLEHAGRHYGVLQLGPHRLRRPYTQQEGDLLYDVASHVTAAIQFDLPHFEPELAVGMAAIFHRDSNKNGAAEPFDLQQSGGSEKV